MTEQRKEGTNKSLQFMGNTIFYGQYWKDGYFQVLDSFDNTPRKHKNIAKKYGFNQPS